MAVPCGVCYKAVKTKSVLSCPLAGSTEAHRGQVALEQGFCGKALPLHADLDSPGVL